MKKSAVGSSWEEARKEIFTPDENAESDIRASIIVELIRARRERGISQNRLCELSGVKEKEIEGIEIGNKIPTVDTLQKLLIPLGKTLAVIAR